jgi:hypothetical protein
MRKDPKMLKWIMLWSRVARPGTTVRIETRKVSPSKTISVGFNPKLN